MGKKVKVTTQIHLNAEGTSEEVPALVRDSEEIIKDTKWTNKQRIVVFSASGVSARDRHLMKDIIFLLPHCKPENKKEKKDDLVFINDVAKLRNCSKCIYFEGRKKLDLYMWISNITCGPSIKFQILNVHTMTELKMTGNCLNGSRPILSFDENFTQPHWRLMKELLSQIFNTPNHHPKSQPFFDHIITFSLLDNKIWFRNFQIVEEDGKLVEIGPRFVMSPIKVLSGSFEGEVLWSNPNYKAPVSAKRERIQALSDKLKMKRERVTKHRKELKTAIQDEDPLEIFKDGVPEYPTPIKKPSKRYKNVL